MYFHNENILTYLLLWVFRVYLPTAQNISSISYFFTWLQLFNIAINFRSIEYNIFSNINTHSYRYQVEDNIHKRNRKAHNLSFLVISKLREIPKTANFSFVHDACCYSMQQQTPISLSRLNFIFFLFYLVLFILRSFVVLYYITCTYCNHSRIKHALQN